MSARYRSLIPNKTLEICFLIQSASANKTHTHILCMCMGDLARPGHTHVHKRPPLRGILSQSIQFVFTSAQPHRRQDLHNIKGQLVFLKSITFSWLPWIPRGCSEFKVQKLKSELISHHIHVTIATLVLVIHAQKVTQTCIGVLRRNLRNQPKQIVLGKLLYRLTAGFNWKTKRQSCRVQTSTCCIMHYYGEAIIRKIAM